MCPHQSHSSTMFLDPVVSLMFFVREHGRGGFLLESCGDCESAGTGSDDDHIEKVREGLFLVLFLRHVCYYGEMVRSV